MSKRSKKHTKGQGSIFLDPPSPYWQISYWNGETQVRRSARTKDYAEAVKLLQRKLTENDVGKWASPERVFVSALLQLVVDDYRRNDRADLRETEQRVNGLLKPAFGHLRVTESTTKALNDYIRERRQAWNTASQLACIPRLRFRDLRRTAARNMFRCGFAESTIKKIAG